MENWNELSLADLRKAAKERGISGCSSKKKSEIILLLEAMPESAPAAEAEKPAERKAAERKPVEKKATERTTAERESEGQKSAKREPAERTTAKRETVEQKATERTTSERVLVERKPAEPVSGEGRQERTVVRASVRPEGRENPEGRPVIRAEVRPKPQQDAGALIHKEPSRVGENPQNRYRQPVVQRDPQDSGITKVGILEIAQEQSFGFIRDENYLPSPDDVYVSPAIIKRFNLTTGDIICGNLKVKSPAEKFVALLNVTKINGENPERAVYRKRFEKLTPVFPHERLRLETEGGPTSVRIVDLLSPIGKGQRGMIVSPPKAGKTTLLKDIARAVQKNNPSLHMIILLIDERPEEVTDMKESIKGDNVEIIYSTFDEAPEKHKRVSEMTIEHAKRLVEYGKDVIILLDSITRLARAYNLTCQSSGRTLSGGLDPAALYMPKKFFGAARCMKEGGSLTILATALVDTGSRMDDVVFEEFKGTGNMELTLNRALSERRIFPAIDLPKSSTRREDLLLSPVEQEANFIMRRAFGGARAEEATEMIVNMFSHTRSNAEFITQLKRTRMFG